MVDGGAPKTDFDEIMGRIRSEVQRRRAQAPAARSSDDGAGRRAGSGDLPIGLLPPDLAAFDARVQAADQVADVGAGVPPMHRQRGLKRLLAGWVAKVFLRFAQLVTRDQRAFNRAVIDAFRALGSSVQDSALQVGAGLEQSAARLGAQQAEQEETLQAQEWKVEALGRAFEAALAGLRQELSPRFDEVAQRQARLEALVDQAAKDAQALRASVAEATAALQGQALARVTEQTRTVETRLAMLKNEVDRDRVTLGNLQVAQLLQDRRTSTLLEELRRQPAGPPRPELAALAQQEQAHLDDAMYVEFEDAYRGTRDDIKRRAREYLLEPLRAAGAGTAERPVLDLGCGRGEWLEVLAEEGLRGRGVDTNRAFVQQCRDRKLDVEAADALAFLKSLPAQSVGAVTAIHVLEHVPFEVLLALLDESVRVLKPGGVAVFETPNPQNLAVGARDFYIDPTHRNPLHPETMRFLAERRGMVRVSVLPLHPSPPEQRLPDDGSLLVQRLNEYLHGPRDFALIGHRA